VVFTVLSVWDSCNYLESSFINIIVKRQESEPVAKIREAIIKPGTG
jgi:hypothetical protein